MLILALILSALNAITGTARSLHQMSTDGQFPRFFQHVNTHGVPDRSMMFNVVCSIVVVFFGGAVEIYTFSNVGYLASFIPVLIGYYLLRKHRPERAAAVQAARVDEVRRARRSRRCTRSSTSTAARCTRTARATPAGRKTLPYYFIGLGRARCPTARSTA